jgi:hypothetical protein
MRFTSILRSVINTTITSNISRTIPVLTKPSITSGNGKERKILLILAYVFILRTNISLFR